MSRESIQETVDCNARWADVKTRFAEPYRAYPDKMLELLNACRASQKLRQTLPYISMGRLGLERWDAYERGLADDFMCLCYYNENFTVSSCDNTVKLFFDTAKAAIHYVEQHLENEKPFK